MTAAAAQNAAAAVKPAAGRSNIPAASPAGLSLRPFFVMTALFSLAVNILLLVSPLYMLQVYDRVLSSGSVETLIMVSIAAIGLLMVYGFAEAARKKVLSLMSIYIEDNYGSKIFKSGFSGRDTTLSLPGRLGDLNTVQSFLQNGLLLPIFDLAFTPIFVFAMFLVHPIIGWIGIAGAAVLIVIAILTELGSRADVKTAQAAEGRASQHAQQISRHRSVIKSLGMLEPLAEQWTAQKSDASRLSLKGQGRSTFFGAQAKGLRQMLQVAALGVGGYLVLQLEVSAGAIIAGSILMGRALSPIDQTLGAWRQVLRARQAWDRLSETIQGFEGGAPDAMPLPRPDAILSIQNLEVAPPGSDRAILPKFNLTIKGGTVIGILGASGSGKTSVLETCVGAWQPFGGDVRLGGRDIHRWDDGDRGQYVGYAPQSVDLLPGTIAQNISRFKDGPPEEIITAARRAGFHDMILNLPDGYDTVIGPGGAHLSQGQCKAVSLARAFYGDPVFLCLDEPGAGLDQVSLGNLSRGIKEAKVAGAIILLSTHDARFLHLADNIMLLGQGALKMVTAEDYAKTLQQTANVKARAT